MTLGVVLAAGEGRRFGGPKAPYVLDGERLVDRAVHTLIGGGCSQVIVVLGAWIGEVPEAGVVVNESWTSGMGSSLRVGLEAAARTDEGNVIVTLVDLPGLTPSAVRRLIESGADAAAASYEGHRGHPVLLARRHWAPAAEAALDDRGARDYLASLGESLLLVEVGDVADGTDLDTRP